MNGFSFKHFKPPPLFLVQRFWEKAADTGLLFTQWSCPEKLRLSFLLRFSEAILFSFPWHQFFTLGSYTFLLMALTFQRFLWSPSLYPLLAKWLFHNARLITAPTYPSNSGAVSANKSSLCLLRSRDAVVPSFPSASAGLAVPECTSVHSSPLSRALNVLVLCPARLKREAVNNSFLPPFPVPFTQRIFFPSLFC